jgi:25S rRNA (uracil2634-N3)-methyltransferase
MGGAKKSRSLSGALAAQQVRLTKKARAAEAEKLAATKGKGKKTKAPPPRAVLPFAPTDSILLLGEGDFSFARALVCDPPNLPSTSYGAPGSTLSFLPPANVTATAYDSEEECYAKYPGAAAIVAALQEKGTRVLFGIDATKLDKCAPLKGRRFARVVWNFPHAGAGIADQDRNVRTNQALILGFLRAAKAVLSRGAVPALPVRKKRAAGDEDEEDVGMEEVQEDARTAQNTFRGTVLITLRNVAPYTLW